MDSQIYFLGTAGSDAMQSQLRSSAGIILKLDGFQIHIDPGPGTLTRAKDYGINLKHTDLILVSHNHLTHCNDMNALIEAMTYSGLDKRGILIGDEATIYGSNFDKPILTRKHTTYLEKINSLKVGERINLGTIKIQGLKTKHSAEYGIGFKIFTDKFILTYTGDTSYFSGLKEEYLDSNILIANTVKPFNSKDEHNLNSEDVVKIVNDVKPQLTIITHFGKQMLSAQPTYEAREIQRLTKIQTIAAKDGFAIDPVSYSPKLRQKMLDRY
ncbi:MBL fold metallo-hydrolase [archaeon]|nr:MBL fold metallo-hydrolase [archaeon]